MNPANYVTFAFGYDAGQLLAGIPFKLRKKICRNRHEDEDGNVFEIKLRSYKYFWLPQNERTPEYDGFGISYLKGKYFAVCKIKWDEENHKTDYFDAITVYDVFSFYQMGLVKVLGGLVSQGYVSQADFDIIKENKERREEFDHAVPFDTIMHYCSLELTATSKALIVLRDGFDGFDETGGIRLKKWHGPGEAAGALLRNNRIPQDHFPATGAPDEIKTTRVNIEHDGETHSCAGSLMQDAAHHAFFGGRIELLRQGYSEGQKLYGYDLVSAYPAACLGLPSMRGGTWEQHGPQKRRHKPIDSYNRLSLFKIGFRLKSGLKPGENFRGKKTTRQETFPFFPLPYRVGDHYPNLGKGSILFPSCGVGWYTRDDIATLEAWLDYYDPKRKESVIIYGETLEFHPATDAKPFSFVEELFQRRAAMKAAEVLTGIYDPAEKNIKLGLNSLYGKLAQKMGGEDGKPPSTANPWYAAAITSWCRRRLMEACLQNPDAIVMLATDGIISTEPLALKTGTNLGDWEAGEATGGMFLQSGVYFYLKDEQDPDKRYVNRLRGGRKSIGGAELRNQIVTDALRAWSIPNAELPEDCRVENATLGPLPAVKLIQKSCVTAGKSVSGPEWDELCGRFGQEVRMMNVDTLGGKRGLGLDRADYETVRLPDGSLRLARRCTGFIPSNPRANPCENVLSAPAYPKWIDKAIELEDPEELMEGSFAELHEQAELFEGI